MQTSFGTDRRNPAALLRITLALLMAIHGIARISLGIVDDFGGFLTQTGFPLGIALAWLITIFEIVGAAILAAGYFVRYLSAGFALQLLMGIFLVHLQHGWFVVGAGQNGIEYSVLLIVGFVVIAWLDWQNQRQ